MRRGLGAHGNRPAARRPLIGQLATQVARKVEAARARQSWNRHQLQSNRNDLPGGLSNAFELVKGARVRHVWPRP